MLRNPLPDIQTYEFGEIPFNQLMKNRIYNVLILCSNYDYYLLEEDGRIDEQIFNEYMALNLRYPPNFLHARSTKSALKILESDIVDLVIIWLHTGKRSFSSSNKIKEQHPNIPIVALTHYSEELQKLLIKNKTHSIDYVFHWNGNVDIFLAIIKLVEDRMNADNDINGIGVKAILLVEDSLRFYSRYLPIIYRVVLKQSRAFTYEGLNKHQAIMSRRGRPKILLAENYEESIALFQKYRENLLGIISDVSYFKNGKKDPRAGFKLLEQVRKHDPYFPFIIQSSEVKNKKKALAQKVEFLDKNSEILDIDIKKYIAKYFSFGGFEFWDPRQKKVIETANNLKSFQKILSFIPLEIIVYHAKRNDFSKWLQSRTLFPLAKLFAKVELEDFTEEDHVREFLIQSVRAFRKYRSRGVIAKFDRNYYDESLVFSRIGEGALGGKARGLAFIDSFLKRHRLLKKYGDVVISIPRTVVLSTEVFDEFMEQHDMFSFITQDHDDAAILKEFTSKPLPEWALEDVKAFLSTSNTPIAIRSSSVLEDSLYHPFAGIFSTYMVPNADKEKLLEMVSNAIKSVMASTFFKNNKAYLKITSHSIEEGKMAVILQEVTGAQYEDVYYPNISGVARSINFYPIGNEKPFEGVAHIALGLGEIIVGGGRVLRFSPYHPKKVLQLTNPDTAQRETQRYFYALEMDPEKYRISPEEDVNKRKIYLRKAKDHQSLKFVASTYDFQNNIIRPGILHDGIRILSFDNILKYNSFPLAEILQDLLQIGQQEMNYPIEIEFAINLDVPPGKPRLFSFLQIKPIVEQNDPKNILPEVVEEKDTIIYAESALGNGKYKNLCDIVYVKPQAFDAAHTRDIAKTVEHINKQFDDRDKHYILIGPGRWGSSDPWLGIPVVWTQISNARVIVESGLDDFRVDPSQGTHFFQNLTSFKVGYLTINPFIGEGFIDFDYLNARKAVYEDSFLRHLRFEKALTVIIEGKNNKAAIFKESYIFTKKDTVVAEEQPPEGFM